MGISVEDKEFYRLKKMYLYEVGSYVLSVVLYKIPWGINGVPSVWWEDGMGSR